MLPDNLPAATCWQGGHPFVLWPRNRLRSDNRAMVSSGWAYLPPPPPYLGEVLGDATPTVGIRDLGVLQVHDPLSHILIEQNSPVVTSCRGGWWTREAVEAPGA